MGVYYAWASPHEREYFRLPDDNAKYPVGDSAIVVFEWLRRERWRDAVIYNDACDFPWERESEKNVGWKNVTADALELLAELAEERARDLHRSAEFHREAPR